MQEIGKSFIRPLLAWILLGALSLETLGEPEQMKFFGSKSVALEVQLAKLEAIGLTLSDGANVEDLFIFEAQEELELNPYEGVIEALGYQIERAPFTPVCLKLWMCDYECIEDHGAYREILERLEQMTGGALQLSEIRDFVDIEAARAWVEFQCEGETIRWEAKVDNDWMDPEIVVRYHSLLQAKGTGIRIYSNETDYGQVAFFGAFTASGFKTFSKLSKVEFTPIGQ